jgi:hypothetical protein
MNEAQKSTTSSRRALPTRIDPCYGVPRLREGKDDKNRRHGSRNGDVVEEFHGVRLRRERNKTLL